MDRRQVQKAETFLSLHHAGKLLVLPNIWDVIGARLLEAEGFPAVATASAAIAYSNGAEDGQKIGIEKLLAIVKEICNNTSLPVSVDFERGYADTLHELGENIRRLITCGAVGLNIEDSDEKKRLIPVDEQCEKISVIRKTAETCGIHLVINARTDAFIDPEMEGDRTEEAIKRAQSYMDAGADCFYPVLCSSDHLKAIRSRLDIPINVIATKDTLPMKELEALGIARLSLGPSVFRAALTTMRNIMAELRQYKDYTSFTGEEILTSVDVRKFLKPLFK